MNHLERLVIDATALFRHPSDRTRAAAEITKTGDIQFAWTPRAIAAWRKAARNTWTETENNQ